MINLVLSVPPESMAGVRKLVGDHVGIEIVAENEDTLDSFYDRNDLDAVMIGEHIAVEYFLATLPYTIIEIIIDPVIDMRFKLYEATISPANKPNAQLHTEASWIVVMGHYAGQTKGGAEIRDSSISQLELEYILFLNVFDVIERHNNTGGQAPIHRLGIAVDEVILPSLLRSYDKYRAKLGGLQ